MKGISPAFSKSKGKRIGLFQKFWKTKHSEVNVLKILQDRSKTNVFVPNCVKEDKRKSEASFFFWKKVKKNEYNRSSTIEDLPLYVQHFCTLKGYSAFSARDKYSYSFCKWYVFVWFFRKTGYCILYTFWTRYFITKHWGSVLLTFLISEKDKSIYCIRNSDIISPFQPTVLFQIPGFFLN